MPRPSLLHHSVDSDPREVGCGSMESWWRRRFNPKRRRPRTAYGTVSYCSSNAIEKMIVQDRVLRVNVIVLQDIRFGVSHDEIDGRSEACLAHNRNKPRIVRGHEPVF